MSVCFLSLFCFFFFFFNDTATTEIYTFPYTTLFRSQDVAAGRTGEAGDERHQRHLGAGELERIVDAVDRIRRVRVEPLASGLAELARRLDHRLRLGELGQDEELHRLSSSPASSSVTWMIS